MRSSRDTALRIVPHFVAYLRKPFWNICILQNILLFFIKNRRAKNRFSRILRKSRDEVILKLHYISAMGTSVHEICTKYQGVKEFHMLARIGCNCKIMVFSPFITYHHSSKGNK